jgi:hypothetical protein
MQETFYKQQILQTVRKILLAILIFIPVLMNANPIWLGVSISEIYFNKSGEWTIEIDNKYITSVEYLDSIRIESNTGSATIEHFDTTDFIVITNSNLSNYISISKNGDLIKIYSFLGGGYKIDSIAIGDYSSSYLHNIENGQSVARLYGYDQFFKDNSPTIGFENDIDGAKGKIFGHFFDLNSELIQNKYFFINEGYCTPILQEQGHAGNIEINSEGFYCAEITSRSYSISEREIYESSTNHELMQFQPVNFELNENDSINIDFHRILTSIEEVNRDKVLLSNYPNPAKDYTYFIFDLNGIKAVSLLITVYSIDGQIIDSFVPNSSEFKWNCSELVQGTYIYTLSIDDQILAAKRLQIVK